MYPNLLEEQQEIKQFDYEGFRKSRKATLDAVKKGRDAGACDKALADVRGKAASGDAALMEAAIVAAKAGATLGEIFAAATDGQNAGPSVEKLNVHRGAEPFERLRRATETFARKNNGAPKIFLANMGPIPQHKARADFSTSFVNVAALETITNNGFPSIDEAAQAALDSGAKAMIICSTDDTYPDIVPELTKKVKAAKPGMMVILAGYPKEYIEAFKEAGVDEFLHIRSNALDLLAKIQKHLEVIA